MTAGHQPNNYLQLAALIPTLTQTPHPTGALESSGGATEGGGAWRGGRNQTHLSGQKPRWAQATGAWLIPVRSLLFIYLFIYSEPQHSHRPPLLSQAAHRFDTSTKQGHFFARPKKEGAVTKGENQARSLLLAPRSNFAPATEIFPRFFLFLTQNTSCLRTKIALINSMNWGHWAEMFSTADHTAYRSLCSV